MVKQEVRHEIRHIILESGGQFSMCWEKPEGTGVFQSDDAVRVGEETLDKLFEYLQSVGVELEE